MIDILGKSYGNWKVIYYKGKDSHNHPRYLCLCKCGKISDLNGYKLITNQTKSCGCIKALNNNKYRERNLIGKRFHNLTVIKISPYRTASGNAKYLMRCDCGNETHVYLTKAKTGRTKSCGCHKRRMATKHGLCGTRQYIRLAKMKRLGMEYSLDTKWTSEMETRLLSLFRICVNCESAENLCVDHVYPLSKGYGLKPGNATILCRKCNASKGSKLPSQLPHDFAHNVLASASLFKTYWECRWFPK